MASNPTLVERRWSSHPRNVQYARETAREFLRAYVDPTDIGLIELALGEACTNAIEHGSPHGERNHFVLRCSVAAPRPQLILEVEDEGREFALTDLSLAETPDLNAESGRGLFLINRIMDQVTLHQGAEGLAIRMTRFLTAAPALLDAAPCH